MGILFSKSVAFEPVEDIPNLEGKAILITGGNSGLGLETVKQLARHNPRTIILCARSKNKAEQALKEIKDVVPEAPVELLALDLASFSSIAAAVKEFNSKHDRLDILFNNAGLMAVPPTKTQEGYEVQFGVNHMGHFLLTKLLLPTLTKTAAQPDSDVRIINLTSGGYLLAPKEGINFEQPDLPDSWSWVRYGHSKLANIKFTQALAEKYPTITSVSVHPGVVNTNLANTWLQNYMWLKRLLSRFFNTVADGAKNQLWASVALRGEGFGKVENGAYYVPVGIKDDGNKFVKDRGLTEKLWTWSEEEVKKHGY